MKMKSYFATFIIRCVYARAHTCVFVCMCLYMSVVCTLLQTAFIFSPSTESSPTHMAVFLNRRAAARYRALASIIPGRERPKETTTCYKISLVLTITN